ncbi:hypothetical protein L7F22_057564 [Adiantum nelumboides]|nr:hypothetical protein [Adiantum nelumboides]
MYIDEVSDYIDREGDRGAQLAETWIPLLLYADDIVLIAESPDGMQRQLDVLQKFAEESGLSVNMGKTKIMVFNTTTQWVRRSAPKFTYGQDNVEYTDAYTYLGVVFTGPKFAMKKAADNRLSRAYAALGGLERMCSQVQFQEPRTKLWLFDTLVTSAMLYGVQVWGPSVDQDSWRAMERPLISMISRMIRAKASVPHAIIRAEVAAPPIEMEALTKSVSFIHGVPKEIMWGIMTLYGSVLGRVRTPEGDSDIIQSTIGVKQGCPLSPTLFGMYIDEVSDYIDREGDRGAQLAETWIPLLLYADVIVLIAESPDGMQRQLDVLQKFAEESGLSVNMGKTKIMVFNTTTQWVRRSAPKFTYGQDNVEYTDAYTYLGVVFTGPKFAMKKVADNRLSRAYAALGGLERMCSQVQFQEPRTKLWLFDTLVTSAMLYGVQVWGPSVDQDSWRAMERPLISMISRMIRAKASVPHAIIRAEVAAPPIEMEALTKSVSFIHGIWNTDRCRYTRSALESSRQLALKGDTSCWYAKTNLWFQRHGFSMDRLPPFQYSLEAPSLPILLCDKGPFRPSLCFDQIRFALATIQNVIGLPWSSDALGIEEKSSSVDIFNWLQIMFGFQEGNIMNQREHLILLIANVTTTRFSHEQEQEKLKELVLSFIERKLLKNYKRWCKSLGCESSLRMLFRSKNLCQQQVLTIGLYLLIWGEAANLRFMPECLCYIFHHMVEDISYVLKNASSKTCKSMQLVYGGKDYSFLTTVIKPMYEIIQKEAERSDCGGHSMWRNYDDLNECFWTSECFRLGWPWRISQEFEGIFNGSDEVYSSRKRKRSWTGKAYVEARSFLHIYRSFNRMWSLYILALQAMIVVAWNGSGSILDLSDLHLFFKISSIFMTASFLDLLQASVEIALSFKAWPYLRYSNILRSILKVVAAVIWVAILPIGYKRIWESPAGQIETSESWSGSDLKGCYMYSTCVAVYILPSVIGVTVFFFPKLRRMAGHSHSRFVHLFLWWSQPYMFIGGGMHETLYTLFKSVPKFY